MICDTGMTYPWPSANIHWMFAPFLKRGRKLVRK